MGDFHPLSMQKEERSSRIGPMHFAEEKIMTFSDDSPVMVRSSSWSGLIKQHFQKRYLCLWVLAALFPFIVLRLIVIYRVTGPLQLLASSPISPKSDDLPHSFGRPPLIISPTPPATVPAVQSTITNEGPLIRPDEDAWITHDEWINHGNGPRVERRKNNGPLRKGNPKEKVKRKKSRRFDPSWTGDVDNFGLPEDNEKEQAMDWVMDEIGEVGITEDTTAAEETPSEGTEKHKAGEVRTNGPEDKNVEENTKPEKHKISDEQRQAEARQVDEANKAAQEEAQEKKRTEEQREAEQNDAENKRLHPEVVEPGDEKKYDGAGSIVNVTMSTNVSEEVSSAGHCDLFDGNWEYDPEGPLYRNSTCFYIQGDQNCMKNGRPDEEYLHWKWKPRGCDLPRFDAKSFLESFRGKTIGFVGDSLARNQMQSLLCMLSQVEIPTQTYQSPGDKNVRWLYEQSQVTLAVLWSPYLLKESTDGVMGFEKGQIVLYLDVLDTAWTSVMSDFDIIVLSIGQWYFKGSVYIKQDEVIGCHYCPTLNLTDVGFYEAYRGAVRQVLEKVAAEFRGIAIMSTFAIAHYEGGSWDNGGQCRRERPLDEEEGARFPGLHNEMHDIVISEFNSVANDKSKVREDLHMEFLDVTRVSLVRADGHPGPYRRAHPYEGRNPADWVMNDCLHWCLPGPVDTWNQLLVKLAHKHL